MSKLSYIFTGAGCLVVGVAIGAGVATMTRDDAPKKKKPVATAKAPETKRSGVAMAATVTATPQDNVLHVRAHTWVGQFAMASVCVKGKVAEPKPCHFEADVVSASGSPPKNGDAVTLGNISAVQGAVAPHTIEAVVPKISVTADVLKGPIRARVLGLIDGDTAHVLAESFPGHYVFTSVRVGGIDTPEKHFNTKPLKPGQERKGAQCPEEAALSKEATAAAKKLIDGKEVLLSNLEFEKYGARVLGSISTLDGVDLAKDQIAKGYAKPYDGGTKQSWCTLK